MNTFWEESQGVSPVMGVILMVAVTVILSAVVGVFVFDLSSSTTDGTNTNTAVQFEETAEGVSVRVATMGSNTELRVYKNGTPVSGVSLTSVGETVSISAPEGTKLSVLKLQDDDKTVIQSYTVKRGTRPASHLLSWTTASDWDSAATSTGVEHSGVTGADRIRLGGLEDDGDVQEFSEDTTIDTHTAQTAVQKIGPYARKVNTGTTTTQYDQIHFSYSSDVAPAKTSFWLKIPDPDNNNWILKHQFATSSGTGITSIGFDGGGSTDDDILTFNGSSWNSRGSYPHNTWFKVTYDWDWANDQYEIIINDTDSRGVEGFRNSVSGYQTYTENWDYNESDITAYVDSLNNPHIKSGSLTTGTKTVSEPLTPNSLTLENATYTLNGESITVYIESDPDGDGTFEETSDPITLDGSSSFNVTGLSSTSSTFRLRTEFSTSGAQDTTPVFNGADLTGKTP